MSKCRSRLMMGDDYDGLKCPVLGLFSPQKALTAYLVRFTTRLGHWRPTCRNNLWEFSINRLGARAESTNAWIQPPSPVWGCPSSPVKAGRSALTGSPWLSVRVP